MTYTYNSILLFNVLLLSLSTKHKKKYVNESFVYVKYLKSQTFVKSNDSAKISVPIVIPCILCDVYVLKNKMHFKL
jgi:hypothetical protein